MKKLMVLLMVAIFCLSLGACGGKTQTDSNEEPQEATNSMIEQIPAAVVHIVINPEFEIHVGNDGDVIAVECLNADAKAVDDKVSVIGKSCKDAIILLLQETVDQGFLKDGGEIKISVAAAEEISNQMDTWNNTVMDGISQVLSDNKLNVNIAFSYEGSENTSSGVPVNNIPSATDADGNTVIETDRGYITFDKDGNKIREVYTADDGTVITRKFDENLNITQAIHARSDGTTVTEDYGGDGKITFRRDEFADGSWTEKSFQKEILVKEIREWPGGASAHRIETEYYTNGNIKLSLDYYTGSSSPYFEVRYYESGVKSYEYNVDGLLYTEITYDSNGNRLTEDFREADGTRWELTYNPDGSYYGYTYYPDGSVWYNEWDSGHNQDLSAQKQIK